MKSSSNYEQFFREIENTSINWKKYLFFQNEGILNFFDFHFEWRIDIAFVWDIPELLIRNDGESITKKQVLVPQDYNDRTYITSLKFHFLRFSSLFIVLITILIFSYQYRIFYVRNLVSNCPYLIYFLKICRKISSTFGVNKIEYLWKIFFKWEHLMFWYYLWTIPGPWIWKRHRYIWNCQSLLL